MRDVRKALSGKLHAVTALVVSLMLLGPGCEKQRSTGPVERAKSSPATVDNVSARPEPSAPKVEEATSPAAPERGTGKAGGADARAAGSAKATEAEPVEMTDVTDATFAEFTGAGVAMVDFWSPRCPPCRLQGPIVEKLAKDFAGRAAIGKLRVDLHRRAPGKFRIMYIPTLILFKDGKEVNRLTGLQDEATLSAALERALTAE